MNIFILARKSQKTLRAFFSAFLIVSMVFSQVALPLVAYAQTEGQEVPETTTEVVVDEPKLPEEPVIQTNSFVQTQDIVVPTVTITAHKVVCDSETDLPNWSGLEKTITSTTAQEFVDESDENCELESNWDFQWGDQNAPDGGPTTVGPVAGYTTFSANTPVVIPLANITQLHLREVLKDGYVPFSNAGDVSAEFYCADDVLNYDNWDFINPVAGQSYHCIGFNALSTPPVEPLSCNPQTNLIQNGDFEAPAVSSGGYSIVPDITVNPTSVLKWLVKFINPAHLGVVGLEIQNNVAGAPAGGSQHAELDGDHPVTIWQDIPTIVGKEYTLTFKYSPRPGRDSADNTIQPKINGAVLGAAVSADGTANSNTVWQTITRTFMGTGSPVKVELSDAGTDTSFGGYVDDVTLKCGEPLPPPPQCNVNASSSIVSDTTTLVDGNPSAVLSYIHPGWTASIPDAKWIWATNPVEYPTNDADLTKVFTKTFTILGTPTGGSLEIAADNNYSVKVNGTTVPVTFDQNNFQSGTQDTYNVLPLLVSGVNTLEFTVTNWEIGQDANPSANPAGLLYKLSLTNDECVTPPPVVLTSTVTMCKQNADVPVGNNGNYYPLPGWTLMLKGANVGSVDVLPNGSDFTIAGVPAGDYILNALGKYTYRGTAGAEFSDAAYSQRDPGDAVYQSATGNQVQYLPWVRENNFPAPNTGWLGVIYNNAPTNWGSIFNPTHEYVLGTTTASLGDMSFKILDDVYGDNSGKITVSADHGYVGITQGFDTDTPGPGCVQFTNVPYGTYTTDEIMRDGWENVSGLGAVVVDSPTEKFVILNRQTPTATPVDGKVHLFKFVDGVQATSEMVNGVSFPMNTPTYGNAAFTLDPDGWTDGDAPYEASTSTMTAGSTYTANENLTTPLVGASCDAENNPAYELVGYSTGATIELAKVATKTLTAPIVTVNGDQVIIVWNKKCGEVLGANTLKVHIHKYIAGEQVANDATHPSFPMTATWQTANLNGGVSSSAGYVLGDYHGGATMKYAADTSPMEAPANYTTSEVTSTESNFLPIGAQCAPGKYRLLGYRSSAVSLENAESMPLMSIAPEFANISTDRWVIVENEKCADAPTTGSIEITKYTCPADFVPNRNDHGVGSAVPSGCTLTPGVAFGYVYGSATDANGPYPELDATPTAGGVTNGSGVLTIGPVLSTGRYLIKETDATNLAGLYCQGDGDTNPNNNDNQELTFVPANGVTKCVAYNKVQGGGGGGDTTSSSTTVVKAEDLAADFTAVIATPSKWFFWNDENNTINNTLGSFVTGPATAPLGTGSAEMSVSGTQRRNIATYQFKDIKLSDIKTLSFSTYSQLAGDGALGLSERASYLNFNVDFDNSDTWQRRLVYVPAQNGVVAPDVWQTWDAINSGNALWVYSGATWPTTSQAEVGVPGTTMKTWNEILVDYPNAETRSTDSWFGFRVGEPYNNGFTGNVDKFVIGIKTGLNTHTETYDFEPTPETNSANTIIVNAGDMKGWEFNSDRNTWTMGAGAFVTGPATPPLGLGSANITTPSSDDRTKLRKYMPIGMQISDIKTLKYSTYRANPNGGALTLALQFDVNFTSTPIDPAKADARIVYEPYHTQQASILDDTWQQWDALDDAAGTGTGSWWMAGPNPSVCPQANPCTWAELNAAYPDLQISAESLENTIDTQGAILFKAGGSWATFDGNVDNLILGIKTGANVHTETYDFEPTTPTPTITGGGGGGGGGSAPLGKSPVGPATTGSVLGASTACGIYLDDFLKMGWKNRVEQVKKLQTFLNDYLKLSPALPVTGMFGMQTYKAVVQFQQQEADLVLQPWVGVTLKDAKKGTGFVYKTTITRINNIMCPELNIATPAAIID